MEFLKNFIVISGTGRNVGKTYLACKIITELARKQDVIGVKISPHFHYDKDSQDVLINGKDYCIYEEKNNNLSKDSSRMLASGAAKVFFIEAHDGFITNAIHEIINFIGPGLPVVCESGSLTKFFRPGLHLHIYRDDYPKPNIGKRLQIGFNDKIIHSGKILNKYFNFSVDYSSSKWKFDY